MRSRSLELRPAPTLRVGEKSRGTPLGMTVAWSVICAGVQYQEHMRSVLRVGCVAD